VSLFAEIRDRVDHRAGSQLLYNVWCYMCEIYVRVDVNSLF